MVVIVRANGQVSVLDSLLEWEGCILKMLCKFKISPPHTKLGNINEAKEFTSNICRCDNKVTRYGYS